MSRPLTLARAGRHEAVMVRLIALCARIEPLFASARAPRNVPAEIQRLAGDILFDARPFLPRKLRAIRGRLMPVADDPMALLAELGQALAHLENFEARHALWSPEHKCRVWCLADGRMMPVARLKPQAARPEFDAALKTRQSRIQEKLDIRFSARIEWTFEEGFAVGLRAAAEGRSEPTFEEMARIIPRLKRPLQL